jgi:deoxyhypusine synthase
MANTTAGARDIGEAVEVIKAMVADKGSFNVLTLSGNFTPFTTLAGELIDRGIVHCVVSTGSICTHTFSVERGQKMLKLPDPDATDDSWLYNRGGNRIFDTLELEESLNDGYSILNKITDAIDTDTLVTSADIMEKIGEYLNKKFPKAPNGLLHAAQRAGIPVIVPSFSDCEIGLDFHAQNLERRKEGKPELMFDLFGDVEKYYQLIKPSKAIGVIELGGGVPRNWAQQIGPFADILTEKGLEPKSLIIRIKYATRFCSAPATEGGLCLHGDTPIDTPRDLRKHPKGIPIRELVGKSGFPVYSYDQEQKRIVLSNVNAVFASGRKKLYKVKYSWTTGWHKKKRTTYTEEIVTSADHKFMMRDGTYKSASELKPADRLMPFNTCYRKSPSSPAAYRYILNVARPGRRVAEHKLVAEYFAQRAVAKGEHVHHDDHNPLNNSPENLVIMNSADHAKHHRITASAETRGKLKASLRKLYSEPEMRKEASARSRAFWDRLSEEEKEDLRAHRKEVSLRDEERSRRSEVSNKYWGELTPEQRHARLSNAHDGTRRRWAEMSAEERSAAVAGEKNGRFIPGLTEDIIREALSKSNGVAEGAARALGVSLKAVKNRMRAYGIKGTRCRGESNRRFVKGLTEDIIRAALLRNRMFIQKAARDIGVSDKVFYRRMEMYGITTKRGNNHYVESVEYWGEDETFDMTVDNTHNFAANSLILKNSGCSFSEGRSWGKFMQEAKGGKFAEVIGDYSLSFPLVCAAVFEGAEDKS